MSLDITQGWPPLARPLPSPPPSPQLTTLQRDGIVEIPGLSTEQVDAVWNALRERPRYAGHVKREGRPYTGQPISCWDMHDLIVAPHFWEWALSFAPLAKAYLGVFPLLYSMNVFETTPHDWAPHPGIEVFHRDADDVKFLALFVYLTDVSRPEDGAHQFKLATHEYTTFDETRTILGPAGTAFLADTRGLHMGIRPTTGPRRMAWARWGVSDPPPSYVRDCLTPLPRARLGDRYPTGPILQRQVRLVVA